MVTTDDIRFTYAYVADVDPRLYVFDHASAQEFDEWLVQYNQYVRETIAAEIHAEIVKLTQQTDVYPAPHTVIATLYHVAHRITNPTT